MRGSMTETMFHMRETIALLLLSGAAFAQVAPPPARESKSAESLADAPGKQLLLSKCFQCHGPNMWIYHRQDRRAWESTLYRMVGKGALWTEDEITAMADYLADAYGKESR